MKNFSPTSFKKNNFFRYLNFLTPVFILLFLITGCEKEETPVISPASEIENNTGIAVKILKGSEIENNKHILKQLNQFKTHNEKMGNKEVTNPGYQFTVNTSSVKYIEKGDYHSYTFPIERRGGGSNIENLVLSLNSNEGYNIFLVQYGFSREELKNMDKQDLSRTSTKYIPIDFDYTNIIETSSKSVRELVCVEVWEYTPDQGQLVGAGNDELEGWYLIFSECWWVDGDDSGDSGGDTGNPPPGDTGGGGGGGGSGTGDDTPCDDFKRVSPCGGDDEIITGPYSDIDNINFKNFKSTLSDQQIFWIENNPEIYDSKIKPFLKENEFAFPAWQFATEAINAFVEGYEVLSIAPLVKYPPGSNYDTLYPKLTEYLKNQLPTIKDNSTIVNAIKTYTNLTTAQIQKHLQWDQGPIIRIEQLGAAYGEFRKSIDPKSLYLDIDLINQLENTAPNSNLANAFAFLIGVTILHEYVHYGDYNNNGDTWQYPQEEGLLFENDAYGQSVWISNSEIILKNN